MANVLTDQTVHYHFPITEITKEANGDLLVYGACTDGTVDSDRQIVDSAWSGKALQDWYETGGNVRVQHSPFLYPAGTGSMLEVNKNGDGQHFIQARVVEPNAKLLVEKKVLKDFSIGIMDPVIVHGDPRAPGGVIKGGFIGEVSLVDRGSNHNSGFKLAKSAANGPAELVGKLFGGLAANPASVGTAVYKKKYSAERRREMASRGHALPDNSYPIGDKADLANAASLQRSGHGDTEAAGRLIASRAKDLGVPNPIKKDWSDWDQAHADGQTRAQGGKETAAQEHTDHEVHDAHAAHVAHEKELAAKKPKKPKKTNATATPATNAKLTNTAVKADSEDPGESDDGDASKTCMSCKAKNDAGAKRCSNCGKKLGMAIKSDAAQDGSVTQDEEENEDEYGGDAQPSAASKKAAKRVRKMQRAALKGDPGNPTRGDSNQTTPVGGGKVDDPAGGKKMIPAGKPRDAHGEAAAETPGSAWKSMQQIHDATCPLIKPGLLRKSWGIETLAELLPVEVLSEGAVEAINKGDSETALWLTEVASGTLSIRQIPTDLLSHARKLLSSMQGAFAPSGDVGSRQFTQDVKPSMFQRGYVQAGHPNLSAQGTGGGGLPSAPSHHVSASDFQRDALGAGHADASPGEGRQASASTAIMGQAMTSMQRVHSQMTSTWPELCPGSASITHHDYTQGEGGTGLRPTPIGTVPHGTAVGESTIANKAFSGNGEADLRRKLAKAQKKIDTLAKENEELGAQPDPFQAAYRGVPGLGGPVDRVSQIDKAAGGAPEDMEFETYLQGLAKSGDPSMRDSARKAITTLVTK